MQNAQNLSKVKTAFEVTYLNYIDERKNIVIQAYTEKQAVFLLFKFHDDCRELLAITPMY